jgi:transposase
MAKNHLGDFFRRMRGKLGRAQAITAVAHKLALIFYTLVTTGQDYDESTLEAAHAQQKIRQEAKLRRQARDLAFQLVSA